VSASCIPEEGGIAIAAGGSVVAKITEQDAGLGEQVAVDPDQLAGLL
jgi:hypothetical protein